MDGKDFKVEAPGQDEMPDWRPAELEIGTVKICQHCGWRRNDHFGVGLACPCADSRHNSPVSVEGVECLEDCEKPLVQGHFLAAAP